MWHVAPGVAADAAANGKSDNDGWRTHSKVLSPCLCVPASLVVGREKHLG